GSFRVDNILETHKANCIGYATVMFFLGRQVGLQIHPTSVMETGTNDDPQEIAHAAYRLDLPGSPDDTGLSFFAMGDVTWINYLSEPIESKSLEIIRRDAQKTEARLPASLSRHTRFSFSVLPIDSLIGSLYSWSGASDEYLLETTLVQRVTRRRL